jgi:hypothetical protein
VACSAVSSASLGLGDGEGADADGRHHYLSFRLLPPEGVGHRVLVFQFRCLDFKQKIKSVVFYLEHLNIFFKKYTFLFLC